MTNLARHQKTPRFFLYFCTRFLEISGGLAAELWDTLEPSQTLVYTVVRCGDSFTNDALLRFADLVTARVLLLATERLSPSKSGKRRRGDIVRLEETILTKLDREGIWK
jgi:hypothetical protein